MKTCWAQYLLWLVIVLLGTGSALSACGQKGDLYLPDEKPANKMLPGNQSSSGSFSFSKKEPAS